MKSNDYLGSLVKERRKLNNMSARKLASLCGISHTEINNIEKGGRVKPALLTLKAFEKYLGIPFKETAEYVGYAPETIKFGETDIIVSYEVYDKKIKEYKEEMKHLMFTIEQKKRIGADIKESVEELSKLVDVSNKDIEKQLNLLKQYAEYIELKYVVNNPEFENDDIMTTY